MKIIFSDFKRGEAKVKVTSLDDLWYLSSIVDEGDTVKGETLRKIKIGESENQKSVRKPVFLGILVEKVEFQKQSNALRISGVINEGPEDVPKGTHHSFNIELNDTITIVKENWLDFQKEKLKEASAEKQSKILLVVFDRDEAHFAYAKTYGYEYLSELKSNLPKKEEETKAKGTYYEDLVKQIEEYVTRYNIEKVIVASPAFWKEYLLKEIKDDDLKKKIITATCSSADKTAFDEVMKRPEVETALKESRTSEEMKLVEELLGEIMKDGAVKYGIEHVKEASDAGAIRVLLVADSFIRKTREENTFQNVEGIMKQVDKAGGKIVIVSSEHEGGKKLNGLGGIASLLRYKMN